MNAVLGGLTSILLECGRIGLHRAVQEHSKVLVQVGQEHTRRLLEKFFD